MKDPLVSVVIPAYNTETYIGKMLDCVARQTYRNVEIIIVNDGSTDGTLSVINDWAQDKVNVKIVDVPNGGVSKARNIGMEMANGDKIFFWDSDDIIEPKAIEMCVTFGQEHEVNAVLYGYSGYVNGIKGSPRTHELKEEYRDREIIEDLIPHFLGHSFEDINNWISGKSGLRQGKESTALWRIMLDADTIRRNNLSFDLHLSLGEDTRFINEYLIHESSVGFIDKCFYYLTMRDTSANRSSLNNATKRLNDKLKLIKARMEIDCLANKLHNYSIHKYWEGTMVLSVIEMAVLFSRNKSFGIRQNFHLYKTFLANDAVKTAIDVFRPTTGFKSIPFKIIKMPVGGVILFWIFVVAPQIFINKILNERYPVNKK